MDVVAALLPSVVMAAAFIAIVIAVLRHTDWSDRTRKRPPGDE